MQRQTGKIVKLVNQESVLGHSASASEPILYRIPGTSADQRSQSTMRWDALYHGNQRLLGRLADEFITITGLNKQHGDSFVEILRTQ